MKNGNNTPKYSTPIQYLDDLFHSEKHDIVANNHFIISKLIDVYQRNDVHAIRDFIGYVNFAIKTELSGDLKGIQEELETTARLMIEEIQKSIYKDRTNGLKLVK